MYSDLKVYLQRAFGELNCSARSTVFKKKKKKKKIGEITTKAIFSRTF